MSLDLPLTDNQPINIYHIELPYNLNDSNLVKYSLLQYLFIPRIKVKLSYTDSTIIVIIKSKYNLDSIYNNFGCIINPPSFGPPLCMYKTYTNTMNKFIYLEVSNVKLFATTIVCYKCILNVTKVDLLLDHVCIKSFNVSHKKINGCNINIIDMGGFDMNTEKLYSLKPYFTEENCDILCTVQIYYY